ncbi:hypothetical protein F0L74_08565 [Chitinophaga agrisoli]|uniref:Uncharacterized protein n=1 Tax=Chitinophaga agrisoli TaxID=2607653 RepID=A0A5B2VVI7_9BACT|nr:hypothetical protein [Chitinophaga agrisoli]KAA2242578.1 hypothetical protein F0L74_08565 [Chitinophaga agrisoli]
MIDFLQNLQTEEHNFQETFENAHHDEEILTRDIPTSQDICGMEIRLSDVMIIDNKTPKVFPFPGLAKVYFMNLVVSDLSADPVSIDLKGFEKIDDGEKLNVDKSLFYWKETEADKRAPSQIHVFCSIIKSKQSLRDVAEVMGNVKNDESYKQVVDTLAGIVKTATSLTSVSSLIFQVAGIVGNYLGKVDDKPLLTWVQSFTDISGDFDVLGTTDKAAENKFASMKLSITIRDTARQKEADLKSAATLQPNGL